VGVLCGIRPGVGDGHRGAGIDNKVERLVDAVDENLATQETARGGADGDIYAGRDVYGFSLNRFALIRTDAGRLGFGIPLPHKSQAARSVINCS